MPIRYYGGKAYVKNGGWISERIPYEPVGSFTEGHGSGEATEVLWTNYEVRVQGSLL